MAENNTTLSTALFSGADALRSKMDANEYIKIIFYIFIFAGLIGKILHLFG